MIDVAASFWSLPPGSENLYVRVRLDDYPDPGDQRLGRYEGTECVQVRELLSAPPQAEYGFRSVALFTDSACSAEQAVNPLVLDLDLDGDTGDALGTLLDRVVDLADRSSWTCRVFRSGEGFHVEMVPASVSDIDQPPYFSDFTGWVRRVQGRLDAAPKDPGTACIDRPKAMVRMVGSRNRKGGRKVAARSLRSLGTRRGGATRSTSGSGEAGIN